MTAPEQGHFTAAAELGVRSLLYCYALIGCDMLFGVRHAPSFIMHTKKLDGPVERLGAPL
jgi:hypothetical protein